MPAQIEIQHPTVYFDGVCNLCNGAVNFLVSQDRQRVLRYAPLQGETAQRDLPAAARENLHSVIYQDEAGVHERSEAILRMTMRLGGIWKIAGLGLLLPRFLRDWLYNLIARNRYRMFGKKDSCRMPTEEERELFLM